MLNFEFVSLLTTPQPLSEVPKNLEDRDIKKAFEDIGRVTKCEAHGGRAWRTLLASFLRTRVRRSDGTSDTVGEHGGSVGKFGGQFGGHVLESMCVGQGERMGRRDVDLKSAIL